MRSLIALLSLSKFKCDVLAFSPLKLSPSVLPVQIPVATSPSTLLTKKTGESADRDDRQIRSIITSTSICMAKPKSGSIVDSYQAVSVNCKKCRLRLFRYRKKNGTKSNLIKCYVERISEDCVNLVANKSKSDDNEWFCPKCDTRFGRDAMIHGRPAIKLVGGKTTMTKK